MHSIPFCDLALKLRHVTFVSFALCARVCVCALCNHQPTQSDIVFIPFKFGCDAFCACKQLADASPSEETLARAPFKMMAMAMVRRWYGGKQEAMYDTCIQKQTKGNGIVSVFILSFWNWWFCVVRAGTRLPALSSYIFCLVYWNVLRIEMCFL